MAKACPDLNLGREERSESSAPASTASSETLSHKLDHVFPPVFDEESSVPSSPVDYIVNKPSTRRVTGHSSSGRNRLHYAHDVNFIPRAYSENSVKQYNVGYGR